MQTNLDPSASDSTITTPIGSSQPNPDFYQPATRPKSTRPSVPSILVFIIELLNSAYMAFAGIDCILFPARDEMARGIGMAITLVFNGGFGIILAGFYAMLTLRAKHRFKISFATYTLTIIILLLPLWGLSIFMNFLPFIIVLPITAFAYKNIIKTKQHMASATYITAGSQSVAHTPDSILPAMLTAAFVGIVPAIFIGIYLTDYIEEAIEFLIYGPKPSPGHRVLIPDMYTMITVEFLILLITFIVKKRLIKKSKVLPSST